MIACGDPAGALGERRQLEHAHRPVPEHRRRRRRAPRRTRHRCPGRCRGPSSRPGSRRPGTVRVCASAENVVGDHDVGGQHDLAAYSEQPPAGVDLVALQQRVADAVALRGEEREAHAAADQQRVHLRQQRVDHGELVGDLGPAEHHHVGPVRVHGEPAQHLDLGEHQVAGVGRQPLRDVVHRRLLAVHHAEPVGDERRRPRRPPRRARSASAARSASSLAVSRGSKRTFSSSATSPSASARRRLAAASLGQRDLGAEQLAEPRGHRAPASTSASGRALRPAEVRGHDHLRAGVGQRLRCVGSDARIRPSSVIRSPSSGTLRSDADQHGAAGDALAEQVVEGLHCPSSELRGDQRGDVDQPVRVAPLVVVPADDLDLVAEDLGQAARRRCTRAGR